MIAVWSYDWVQYAPFCDVPASELFEPDPHEVVRAKVALMKKGGDPGSLRIQRQYRITFR